MNLRQLYRQDPGDQYRKVLPRVAKTEAEVVDYLLDQYGFGGYVDVKSSLITPQFFGFAVTPIPGRNAKVSQIINLQNELSVGISNLRARTTRVRVQDLPLLVEVPSPWPRPIPWQSAALDLQPAQMLAGRYYDIYEGSRQLVLDFTSDHHVLVAGMTGAGKSVLLAMLIYSLVRNTSPTDLELWLCDLKGQDLPIFRHLPHVRSVATDLDSAEDMMAQLYALARARSNDINGRHHPRVVCVIDEAAEIGNTKGGADHLNRAMALGRELNVNVVMGTQNPTKEDMGGISTKNAVTKLVGVVETARAANFATGRAGTGAQFLPPNQGAFLYIHGGTMQRFQSFLFHKDKHEQRAILQQEIAKMEWGAAPPRVAIPDAPAPTSHPTKSVAAQRISPELAAVFRQYHDGDGGLKWGGMKRAMEAIYDEPPTGGPPFNNAKTEIERLLKTYLLISAHRSAPKQAEMSVPA